MTLDQNVIARILNWVQKTTERAYIRHYKLSQRVMQCICLNPALSKFVS